MKIKLFLKEMVLPAFWFYFISVFINNEHTPASTNNTFDYGKKKESTKIAVKLQNFTTVTALFKLKNN